MTLQRWLDGMTVFVLCWSCSGCHPSRDRAPRPVEPAQPPSAPHSGDTSKSTLPPPSSDVPLSPSEPPAPPVEQPAPAPLPEDTPALVPLSIASFRYDYPCVTSSKQVCPQNVIFTLKPTTAAGEGASCQIQMRAEPHDFDDCSDVPVLEKTLALTLDSNASATERIGYWTAGGKCHRRVVDAQVRCIPAGAASGAYPEFGTNSLPQLSQIGDVEPLWGTLTWNKTSDFNNVYVQLKKSADVGPLVCRASVYHSFTNVSGVRADLCKVGTTMMFLRKTEFAFSETDLAVRCENVFGSVGVSMVDRVHRVVVVCTGAGRTYTAESRFSQ